MTMDALYATNVPSQSPASNGDPLTLDTTQLTEGTSITHTGGASDINITESGVYLISYSTVATNTTGAGTASVQLEENGTAIPGSVTSETLTAASDTATLAATVIISVPGTAPITLNMVGTGLSFTNTSVAVTKLS